MMGWANHSRPGGGSRTLPLLASGLGILLLGAALPVAESRLAPADGEAYDNFGYELATDGNRLIVGASRSGGGMGAAYAYTWEGVAWGREEKLLAGDRTKDDQFGNDVDVSQGSAVVGAPHHDPGDSRLSNKTYGAAYFFRSDPGGWVEEVRVHASEKELNMGFGHAVAVDGNHAVVSAPFADVGGTTDQGRAFVFQRGMDGWSETQVLTAPDGHETSYFGQSVEIAGDYLFVGSGDHRARPNGVRVGAVWVFHRDTLDVWNYQARLSPSDLEDGDAFGVSIASDGDMVVIGAENGWGAEVATGVAYVFRLGEDGWVQEGKLQAADGMGAEFFGSSLGISEDTIVVGAWQTMVDGVYAQGSAYRYERSGSGWRQVAKLLAGDGGENNYFGHGVAVGDGRVMIGAHEAPGSSGTEHVGAVYTYH